MIDAGFEADTSQMEQALAELQRESVRSDYDELTMNARDMVKSVVYNTPKETGNARAGWWPAWTALDLPGSPGTTKRLGQNTNPKRPDQVLIADGSVNDERRKRGEPSFAFTNRSAAIHSSGKRMGYIYVLNRWTGWFQEAVNEATFKFRGQHEKLLRKHSAR